MRALVTGASGFLGRHLCRALTAREDFVVALVRDAMGVAPLYNCCVTVWGGFDQVERTIAEYEIDTVFHLAAQTQVSTAVADPVGTFEANVRGTYQVLDACRRQKVKRVIVASSDKAYGTGPSPYVETQPLSSHGIYATSKLCSELIAQAYSREYDMSIAVTRCGNLYGSGHLNWSTLIPGTIRSVLRNERPRLRSNGGPKRDYLYIADAVDGYLKLADSPHRGAFNFGTGRGSSVQGVVSLITHLMGSSLEPIISAEAEGIGIGGVEIEEQVLNCDKARDALGWVPVHTLEEGLRETIDWYRTRVQ